MHDEFRISVQVPPGERRALISALEAHESEDKSAFGRVAVSQEGEHLFMYTDSREDLGQAYEHLRQALSEYDIHAQISKARWHPEQERWEDASVALPSSPAEHEAEHQRLERLQTEESLRSHEAQWEVRITLPSHHDAVEFAERLQEQNIQVLRRWRYLIVSANDEDDARALAERLRAQAPKGSELGVEGAAAPIWIALNEPARHFAIFGGLAQ